MHCLCVDGKAVTLSALSGHQDKHRPLTTGPDKARYISHPNFILNLFHLINILFFFKFYNF